MADKVKAKKSKAPNKKAPVSRVKKREVDQISKTQEASFIAKKSIATPEAQSLSSPENVLLEISPQIPPLEKKFEQAGEEMPAIITPKANSGFLKPEAEAESLNVRLSRSLLRKLKDQALDEGITLEEFVSELLAESVVLRAWEIVERKNHMKGSSGNNVGNSRNAAPAGPNQANRGQRGNKPSGGGHRGGMNPMRYQNIMEDKATFLEYVRNQERNRR